MTIGTYLPVWGDDRQRFTGEDEDAVTMAVEAGLLALDGERPSAVVIVSRDFPLLEGGNAAVLLAGLGLDPGTEVTERLGGASAVIDALAAAAPDELIIGTDTTDGGPGAAAVMGVAGGTVTPIGRTQRSLPLRARGGDGVIHDYDDGRLQRERGTLAAYDALGLSSRPIAAAGLADREAAMICSEPPASLPTRGASSVIFALAALADSAEHGAVVGFDQASASAITIDVCELPVRRHEPAPQPAPLTRVSSEADIKIALPAYDRAFQSKVRWQAGACNECGELSFPPRVRCLACGSETGTHAVALARRATVYTTTTVHVPVPGLSTPYSLAVVEVEGTGVRHLVKVADAPVGSVSIGDEGSMVLRRVAVRSGVSDYGYSFRPDASAGHRAGVVADSAAGAA
jgi:uncharacterized OB-fold protein